MASTSVAGTMTAPLADFTWFFHCLSFCTAVALDLSILWMGSPHMRHTGSGRTPETVAPPTFLALRPGTIVQSGLEFDVIFVRLNCS